MTSEIFVEEEDDEVRLLVACRGGCEGVELWSQVSTVSLYGGGSPKKKISIERQLRKGR